MHKRRRHSIFFKLMGIVIITAILVTLIFSVFHVFPLGIHFNRLSHFIGIGVLIVIFIISHHYLEKIINPIQLIKEGVKRLSKGNYDVDIPIRSADEIGELAKAFNDMARKVQNTLKSKDQLLADVNHELKTPLTRLKLALELSKDEASKKSMEEDIKELEDMINELLESHKLTAVADVLNIEEVDLIELIKEVSNAFSTDIKLVDLPGKCVIPGDRKRLKSVFQNIIDNAMKYSLGDSIPIEIKLSIQKNEVIVTIKDDGEGIPEEHLPNIFKPFYRVDSSRSKQTGGHGLGLNLCEKIIKAHKGDITIQNNIKRGVIVSIRLPEKISA